jgi:hypothetical protein
MRYSTVLMVTMLAILLTVAAGCTSTPAKGPLTGATDTTALPVPVVTTASPASTPVVTVTTGTKCLSGQTACADGTCRDTTSDHDACGGCGNVCPAGYVCKASSCVNPAAMTQATGVAIPATTTQASVPANPATTTVPTTTPTLAQLGSYRSSGAIGSGLQFTTVTATTYPPNVQTIDCSKHPMSITSISPSSGPKAGGTPIVIHGSGFKSGAYIITDVQFGPSRSVSLPGGANSDTEIVINTPGSSTAGTVDVRFGAAFNGVSNHCLSPVTAATKFTYT